MAEPNFADELLKPTPTASADQRFYVSEPVDPQPVTPPVNTDVRADQLVQGGNPFGDVENVTAVTAVAANYQGQPEHVEPVGFLQEESLRSVDAPATPQPFRRDDVAPAAEPTPTAEASPFALFGADTNTSAAPEPASAIENKSVQVPAANRAGSMQFFNAGGDQGTVAPPAASTTSESSPFYQEDDAPLRPTPSTEEPPAFDNTPMFDSDSTSAPPVNAPDVDFPAMPDRRTPSNIAPAPEDDGFGQPGGLF